MRRTKKEAAGLGRRLQHPALEPHGVCTDSEPGGEMRLLELICDVREGSVEAGADHVDGGDDHHRNSGGNQPVLNSGSP
jgi:hypothetical protein